MWVDEKEWDTLMDGGQAASHNQMNLPRGGKFNAQNAYSHRPEPSRANQEWRLSLQEYYSIKVSMCIVAYATH